MAAPSSKKSVKPTVAKAVQAQPAFPLITAHNDTYSPLLRLPGEIRNRIYDFVFISAPYKMAVLFDEETGDDLGVQIQNRPLGIDLTRVCRKIFHESALLPLLLNEFRCTDIEALGQVHVLLRPAQREVIRKLTVEVKLDTSCLLNDISLYTEGHKTVLSTVYPKLERVDVVARMVDYSSTWQQNWPSLNTARLHIMQDNKTALEDWLRDGAKEGFEVVFEEVATKQGAWE